MSLSLGVSFAALIFGFSGTDSFFASSNICLDSLCAPIATPKDFLLLLCEMMRMKLLMCQVVAT